MTALRLLDAAAVHAALPLAALADALAAGLQRPVMTPLRAAHALSADDALLLMPAWDAAASGGIGVKLVTVMPGQRAAGGRSVQAIYVLLDRATGAARAVLDGEALTVRRTAAASLLAARHLARHDARRLLVVGTGTLAPWMAQAHCAARGIEVVQVWGRQAAAAQTLAASLRAAGLPAQAVDDLAAAVRAADIITCATTSTVPLVQGAWLSPGTHVDLVGGFRPHMREADDAALARATLFVDSEAALAEAGDLVQPLAAGVIAASAIAADLRALAAGAHPGRRDASEVTLFKSVGMAVEDLIAAECVLAAAG